MDKVEFRGISFLIKNPPLHPIAIQDLSVIEVQLGFLFPEDYRAFIATLGLGETNLSIRTFSPQHILSGYLTELRDRLAEYWFWNENPDLLTQSRAMECVPFFDSYGGDDIIFHPSDRNRWFILPHEEEEIYVVSSFQELCKLYSRRLDNLQPPFEFHPDN
jgi:SMI1 / KNR4 family (SUKH-1)